MQGRTAIGIFLATAMLFGAACQRERHEFRGSPSSAVRHNEIVRLSENQPGVDQPALTVRNKAQTNAYDISEGQRLYDWYNCTGCHAHGGGGMGPALIDDLWIYGSEPENIHETIVEGRPNGMPSFGGKIPENQVWQIVAYVRSMSGHAPKAARPGRPDAMQAQAPAQLVKPQPPQHPGSPQ